MKCPQLIESCLILQVHWMVMKLSIDKSQVNKMDLLQQYEQIQTVKHNLLALQCL